MKLDYETSSSSYKFLYRILKISGFLFFTVKTTTDNAIKFHRTWGDCLVFIMSMSLTLTSIISSSSPPLKLQSIVLNMAGPILAKSMIYSVILSKCVNFIQGRGSFKILTDYKWFDEQVGISFQCLKLEKALTTNGSQMQQLKIDGNNKKHLIVNIAVPLVLFLLFFLNMFISNLIFSPIAGELSPPSSSALIANRPINVHVECYFLSK